jgi:hypothetical protein
MAPLELLNPRQNNMQTLHLDGHYLRKLPRYTSDNLIDRAGSLCKKKGWTLLKTAALDHDMRADVPSIGTKTIEQVSEAGCRCIAVGTGRVILLDAPAVIDAANKAGVALVGIHNE